MNYPKVRPSLAHILDGKQSWIGIDWEWNKNGEPTILGLSRDGVAGSVPVSSTTARVLDQLVSDNISFVGHNVIDADRPVTNEIVGRDIPLERWEDTLVLSYLCNAEFASTPKSVFGGDEEGVDRDQKGIGMLNLWTTASIYTDLPQWKKCRGERCSGPCPRHDVFGYNGLDALAPDLMFPLLDKERKEKKIPNELYTRTKRLLIVTGQMRERGVAIDRVFVERLENEFQKRKATLYPKERRAIDCGVCARLKTKPPPCKNCEKRGGPKYEEVFAGPFNPQSPSAALEYFDKEYGIKLAQWTKDDIERAMERTNNERAREELQRAYDYKDEGKGLKSWFDERYGSDLLHPRFNPCGTATGRFSSSNPNFQNIPKAGFGKQVRRAIIPRSKDLLLLKSDYGQIEFRMVLWYAFQAAGKPYPGAPKDIFAWLRDRAEGRLDDAARRLHRSSRYIAKRVVHALNYGEGLTLLSGNDLMKPRTKKAIEVGALEVHYDWTYHGKIVAFTGSNLASGIFGSASFENRKEALALQNIYNEAVPEVRRWQRGVTRDIEDDGYVRSATGRYLDLSFADSLRQIKMALSFKGQGGGVDYIHEAILRYADMSVTPLLMVHDELVFEWEKGKSDKEYAEVLKVMEQPSRLYEGFICPIDMEKGENWLKRNESNPNGLTPLTVG